MNKELILAIEALEKENGIDKEIIGLMPLKSH